MKLGRDDYLGHRQEQILTILESYGASTTSQIVKIVFNYAGYCELNQSIVLNSLYALQKRGLVSKTKIPVELKRPRCGVNKAKPRKTVNQWCRTKKPNTYGIRKESVVLP